MEKRKVIAIIIAVVLVTNVITLYFSGLGVKAIDSVYNSLVNTDGVSLSNIEKYNYVKDLLKSEYVDNVDDNLLMEGAIRGLAESINDPYTEYMDKNEFEKLETYTKANYPGIGVVVGVNPKDKLIIISEVFDNSPAQKSKLSVGDEIIKVNDIEVTGDELDKAVSMIKGEKGTKVKITVWREETKQTLDFEVIRDEIEIITVKTKELSNDIGYIRIIQFADNTSQEFKNALVDLKSKGMKKLVIDLRDNPGGLLDQVVEVCGQLLPKGLVVYTIDRDGNRKDSFSQGKGIDMPYIVLINERSASASEILAGAVKDYSTGKLIGTKTYGKGVVQSVFKLKDGSGLKVTTSKYYTPKGISINKIGVQPDILVELNSDKSISKLTQEEDVQIKKAIEVLGQ